MIHPQLSAFLLLPLLGNSALAVTANEPDPPSLVGLAVPADGPSINGWLEAAYNDNGGNFAVGRNRIQVGGEINDYGYLISVAYDEATATVGLQDAYATATYGSIGWTLGQFRAPTTSSHLVTESHQFFVDRTGFGGGGVRQTGLMASSSFDRFGWALAVMDDEGSGDEDLHARVTFDVIGSAHRDYEGSYDALDTSNLSLAAALDSGNGGDTTYIEATYSAGSLWALVELTDSETSSPLTISATYAVNSQYEVGYRAEDPDGSGETRTSFAVSRYVSGHDCKWTLQFDDGDDHDTERTEDQRIAAGFLVSF